MSAGDATASAAPEAARSHTRARWLAEALVGLPGAALLVWAWQADRGWYERHLLWTSCVYEPSQLSGLEKTRWALGILGAVVVLVVRPLVVRRAARRASGELFGATLRIGLAVAMSLVAVDVILRINERIHDGPRRPIGLDLPIAVSDAEHGWRPERSTSVVVPYGDRRIEYVTDAAGIRVRSANEPTDYTLPAILFPGESITFGFGLPYDATYPALVAERTNLRGVNLAVSAYSNDQAYGRLREELPRFEKPVAVVTLVVPVQLLRNSDRRFGHWLPREDGSTEVVRASSAFVIESPVRDVIERRIGYHSAEHLRIARDVIRATARDARSRGAYPLFVLANWREACLPADDGGPAPLRGALFDGLDAPFIDVALDATWWDATIDHPGARAHAHLAERILQALGDAGVVQSR